MSQDYEVFDMNIGEFTNEDSNAVLSASDEFDRVYQIYLAEKAIVKTILEKALLKQEDSDLD